MDQPAAVGDVQARFPRPLTDQEQAMAGTLLDDAWTDLKVAVVDLEERLDVDPAPADLLASTKRVLAQAVKRVLLNPYGRKQESRGIDDANRSWTMSDAVADGALYFTDEDLDLLRSGDSETDPNSRGKAFSVVPSC